MNYYTDFDWKTILSIYPKTDFDISKYHRILSADYPLFIQKYIDLPIMKRLSGIGLLCGTDYTNLYQNRFYYSRLDHSIGVALIIWNFTHDKEQTLSGLFHDISTPVFSHVSDFRKGDALTQTTTEAPTATIIHQDKQLMSLLKNDGIEASKIEDYHLYPIADNEIPQLSADRLEYMFPSGAALEGSWTLSEIEETYKNIRIVQNESHLPELGFLSEEIALNYCKKFCMTGHILQLNENKLTLQLLGEIMNKSVSAEILNEDDFMSLSEKDILQKLDNYFANNNSSAEENKIKQLYHTFRTMTKIEHTQQTIPNSFCVSLQVKQRYINPLVFNEKTQKSERLTQLNTEAAKLITDFKSYKDTPFGCVKINQQ